MKNPAISVIIPMYNTEKYIGECLQSLVNQTFQDFEVLVADDCSTDNSREIAQSYMKCFGGGCKLILLSRNTDCPGIPRNFALAEARGKYIYFLDSDDVLAENTFEEFYNVAEKFNADVVHAEKYVYLVEEDGKFKSTVMSFQKGGFVEEPTLETFDIAKRVTDFINVRFLWHVHNKLFRRQFLVDNNIKFPALSFYQDVIFAFECVVMAKNYVRVPFVSYCYRKRNDSQSNRQKYFSDIVENTIGVVKFTDSFMLAQKFFVDNPQYRYAVIDFLVQERLRVCADLIGKVPFTLGEIYAFVYKEIFSKTSEENIALISYLFVAASVFKLITNKQSEEKKEVEN